MTEPRYRLRLYGQSGDDPVAFARSLAALLKIDRGAAEELLGKAPVVIKEDLSQDEAEKLREIITIIRGLCLVEPMDGGSSEALIAAFPLRLPKPEKKGILDQPVQRLAWLGIGALFLIVLVIGAFALTPKTAVAPREPGVLSKPSRVTTQERAARQKEMVRLQELSEEDLEYEQARLEEDVIYLTDRVKEIQKDIAKLNRLYSPNPEDMREKKVEMARSNDLIRAKAKKIRRIRNRLDSMKMAESLKRGY